MVEARVWPDSSVMCNPPKEKKEHSFWDAAPLWTLGPGPANGGQNSMEDRLFTLPYSFFSFCQPGLHALLLESGQLLPCLKPMTPTNWIIIIYFTARLSCSQSLKNQLASLPVPFLSQRPSSNTGSTLFSQDFAHSRQQQLLLTSQD